MKQFVSHIIFFSFSISCMSGQHIHEEIVDSLKISTPKIENITDLFTKGSWGGHVRNYLMVTDHYGDYKTQYANAIGMKIHYTTAKYYGFDMGLGGIFTFDLFSSDLSEIDPRSGRHPAFELQLFDINRPENKYDLDRLEELFIRYRFGKSTIVLGRHEILSPFVNPADGRMKPYAFQGLTIDFRELKSTNIFASYITHVSPRSTVEWYTIEESIGIYNQGVNPKGEPGDYAEHTRSKGLAILGVDHGFGKDIKVSGTYYYAENVLSSIYLKTDFKKKFNPKWELFTGVEGMIQSKAGQGGNQIEYHSYVCDQDENYVLGAIVGSRYKSYEISLSGLFLGDRGRFLFPREWGRENFYATVPRGRVEGTGNGSLYRVNLSKSFKSGLKAQIDYTYFDGPGTKNVEFNKYKTPDYNQLNIHLGYNFHGWLKGTSLDFLYVYSDAVESVEPEVEYYQVNYSHYNLIMNIVF